MTVFSGWLYEHVDNFVSGVVGISALHSWKRKYVLMLETNIDFEKF